MLSSEASVMFLCLSRAAFSLEHQSFTVLPASHVTEHTLETEYALCYEKGHYLTPVSLLGVGEITYLRSELPIFPMGFFFFLPRLETAARLSPKVKLWRCGG